MMKTLLTLFVLLFSSSVFAEDISDLQIEGISIGDSLLEYMTESEIIKQIEVNKFMYYILIKKATNFGSLRLPASPRSSHAKRTLREPAHTNSLSGFLFAQP